MDVIYDINIGQIIVSSLSVITILVAVIGWFANQSLNRKNETAKELRGYRLDLLQSIIDLQVDFDATNEFNEGLYRIVSSKIKTFGNWEEVEAFNNIDRGKKSILKKFIEIEKVIKEVEREINTHEQLLREIKEKVLQEEYDSIHEGKNSFLEKYNCALEVKKKLSTDFEKNSDKLFIDLFSLFQKNIRKELKLEKRAY